MRTPPRTSRVKSARENAGLTQEQLAVKAGISSTTVYLAERAGIVTANTAPNHQPLPFPIFILPD